MSFLDCLHAVLQRSLLANVAREAMLLSLENENANLACKRISQSLRKSASLVDTMEACASMSTAEEHANFMAEVFAVAIKQLIQQGRGE